MSRFPWYWYVMIIMSLYILFLKSCSNKCPAPVKIETVKSDTAQVPIYLTVHDTPKAVVHTKWDTAYLPANSLDTAGIVKDYMTKRAVKDVVPTKFGNVTIDDVIYQNKVADRHVVFDMKMPVITSTNMIQPKNQVYAGIDLGSNGSFISMGPELILRTKSNKLYWAGASFTSESKFYYHAGAAFLIHL